MRPFSEHVSPWSVGASAEGGAASAEAGASRPRASTSADRGFLRGARGMGALRGSVVMVVEASMGILGGQAEPDAVVVDDAARVEPLEVLVVGLEAGVGDGHVRHDGQGVLAGGPGGEAEEGPAHAQVPLGGEGLGVDVQHLLLVL